MVQGRVGNHAGQSSAVFGGSWTDVSAFGSQVFGQALMDSCVVSILRGFNESVFLGKKKLNY